jgi:hypothetical protein
VTDWLPITDEVESSWGWDAPLVRLRDDNGNEAVGRWEYENENCDGDYWFAWHNERGDPLGFTPTHYQELIDCEGTLGPFTYVKPEGGEALK